MRFFRWNGQAATVEYVLAFLLVVGAISAMMVYVRRALQGRQFDVHRHMIASVNAAANSTILTAYEPYYASTSSETTFQSSETTRLNGTGVFTKVTNRTRASEGEGMQTPPQEDNP